MLRVTVLGMAVAFTLAFGASPVRAQFDHLHCLKIKADRKVKGLVDLAPADATFPTQADCQIVGPKLYCGPVDKQNVRVEPPGPGVPPVTDAAGYLCYKAKCPAVPAPFEVTDQFGTFTVAPKKSFLLCTPATTGAVTTTTVGPGTTTSTILPSTTTTIPECVSGACGSCGDGSCCANDVICEHWQNPVCGAGTTCPNTCVAFGSCTPAACVADADCGAGKACIDIVTVGFHCCDVCP